MLCLWAVGTHEERLPREKACKEGDVYSAGTKQPSCEVRRQGFVEGAGHPVEYWLHVVRADLVPLQKFLEGDTVTIQCVHGDNVLYPLANGGIQVDGLEIEVEAAISEKLPVAVLLGKDVPELSKLLRTDTA